MSEERPWILPPRVEIGSASRRGRWKTAEGAREIIEIDDAAADGRPCTLRYGVHTPALLARATTLYTKEPNTIEWLRHFEPGAVFVDIGANVGLYSVYAAVVSGARVFAFEPESQNYAELNRNVVLNKLSGRVTAYCLAVVDRFEVSRLLLNTFATGYSHHDFGARSRPEATGERLAQGSVSVSLDALVRDGAIPFPDHVKVDVDGHEPLVIEGARQVLEDARLKTLLLECDPALPTTGPMVQRLLSMGFGIYLDHARVSRYGIVPLERARAAHDEGRLAGNLVFARDPAALGFMQDYLGRLSEAQIADLTVDP